MRQKLTIMLAIMASMLFAALNQTIVGTALPRIVTELGGMEYFNWVFTIFMLTSSVTAILVGKLSDIYGRKPFILSGLGIFMVGSFLCGTSADMIQLIIYRGVQGFGGGMIMSTAFTAVGDLFPPRERGRWQGLMGSVFGLASVFGPTLGGLYCGSLRLALGVLGVSPCGDYRLPADPTSLSRHGPRCKEKDRLLRIVVFSLYDDSAAVGFYLGRKPI
ncbi:Major Facilitator Superfamily protein [Melghirimyces thermohalophilus]|uniref:Major Facilitator Superfamily protein n=1 Tax=Melghirimyces thermohalophilus TaxID=1236220 RepID=A0A1G6MPP0_9BACL|nr:Major Facilitator Superfamily protein [Melghirimyces thermohalophilus]